MESEDKKKLLIELKIMIESPIFQEYIAVPMKKYMREQTNSFFSDSLKDAWRKGGRVEAVNFFFKRLKIVDEDIRNLS